MQDIRLERQAVQYLYSDGDLYHFMDTETYEQPALSADILGDGLNYLADGTTLSLLTHDGEAIDIELPITVELEVVDAEPGYAGDTAQGATKEVTLSTGLKLQTPLFVQVGVQILIGPLGLRSIRSIWIPPDGLRISIQIAGAVSAVFLILWLVRRRIVKNLRLELTARGMPTCVPCGYDLTGNASGAHS